MFFGRCLGTSRKKRGIALQSKLRLMVEKAGDPSAADAVFATLYSELRRLSKWELARRGGALSLGATTLLDQAYLEIAADDQAVFADRGRFMVYASRIIRGLMLDHARHRSAQKRGGQFHIISNITSREIVPEQPANDRDLVLIGDALEELAKSELSLVEIVELKFFCGFTFAEIAAMKNLSEHTVERQWEKARMYLYRWLAKDVEQ
jgi:RNA polymerase sigma factor (TIGR02999 family)